MSALAGHSAKEGEDKEGSPAAAGAALLGKTEERELLLEEADRLSWEKNYAAADAAYTRLLELYPDCHEGRLRQARVRCWSGDYEAGLLAYSDIDQFPSDLQPLILMEGNAKRHINYRELMGAIRCYQELIDQSPDNIEARFDLGQLYCRVGRPSCAREQYFAILEQVPDHTAAKKVLLASHVQSRPTYEASYHFLEEEGRDDLKDVNRHRMLLQFFYPFCGDRDQLRLDVAHSYYTLNNFGEQNVSSAGFRWDRRWNLHQSSSLWVHVHYFDHALDWTGTYGMEHSAYIGDALYLSGGIEGEDLLENRLLFQHRVSAHTAWIAAALPFFGPDWELRSKFSQRWFTDHNWGSLGELTLTYTVNPAPCLLMVSAQAFGYHVKETTIVTYDGSGEILSATHPYWTPDYHLQRSLGVQWQHHPCEDYFCEIDPFFYDLQYQFSIDRENEVSHSIRAEVALQDYYCWTLKAQAYYLHSDPYKAAQASLLISRRI